MADHEVSKSQSPSSDTGPELVTAKTEKHDKQKQGLKKRQRSSDKTRQGTGRVRQMIRRSGFQRGFFFLLAVAAVFFVVLKGATPERYRLEVGDISTFDINAPREIVNQLLTEELAQIRAEELPPVIIGDDRANIDMLNGAHTLAEELRGVILNVRVRVDQESVETPQPGYYSALFRAESAVTTRNLLSDLTEEELTLLLDPVSDRTLAKMKFELTDRVVADLTRRQVTEDNLAEMRQEGVDLMRTTFPDRPWSVLGASMIQQVIKPNSHIDREATAQQQDAFILTFERDHPVLIREDERILNKDDVVTEDKLQVLKELNFIESEGGPDLTLYAAIFVMVGVLSVVTLLFIQRFQPQVFKDQNLVALTALIVVLVSLMGWLTQEFLGDYAYLLFPVFVAPVLLATLVGLETAIIVNASLSLAYMFMYGGNPTFALMAFAGGSVAAFLTFQANQRRRLSMSGVAIGAINAAIVVAAGLIGKKGLESLLNEGGLAFLNGILSMILAIGLLPFLEGAFNVITPFKLLELADPNHPLIKRLLLEAPGTYHHSLMVGNLAEAAIRSMGGNALLARVGAYFHDIGKLKRPNFFKENQLVENPHERLTPNLSTLVITSHTRDGDELAQRFRLPRQIRDIVREHHGTTLVAYFYHKAMRLEKEGEVDPRAFRYEGPVPGTRESAVVMLADSIEAAVRSMPEKTQGKIEGLVRKIIRDKLDDGQLDRCALTLRDLSQIADSFLQVLGGAFHERPVYPEIEKKNLFADVDQDLYAPLEIKAAPGEERKTEGGTIHAEGFGKAPVG